MGLGDIVLQFASAQLSSLLVSISESYNQLLNEHRLSDTGTSEETNFPTTSVRSKEIYNFDTGNENLSGC